MLDFQCKSSTTINGFEIKAYDVDPKFDDALKNLLKNNGTLKEIETQIMIRLKPF